MEHTAKVLTSYEEQLNNAASILPAPAENIWFFDIETTGLIMVRPLTSLIWKRNTAQIICRPRLPGSRHLTFTGQSNTSKNISRFPIKN